jgi:hypothetical protein
MDADAYTAVASLSYGVVSSKITTSPVFKSTACIANPLFIDLSFKARVKIFFIPSLFNKLDLQMLSNNQRSQYAQKVETG